MNTVTVYRLKSKALPYKLRCLIGDYLKVQLHNVDVDKTISIEFLGYYWSHLKFIIAVQNDNIVGYIAYYIEDNSTECLLHTAYVDPAYREQGIFKKMYSALQREAKARKTLYITSTLAEWANHKESKTFNRKKLSTNVRDYL